jgi:hypothetical protein
VKKYTSSPIVTLMSIKMPPYSQLRKPGQGEKLPDKDWRTAKKKNTEGMNLNYEQ